MAFNLNHYREITDLQIYQDTALGVMRWGHNNAFPQTLKNLIEKSPSGKSAVTMTTRFLKGNGFIGEDTQVHPMGITLKDLVSSISQDLATFDGFAIHMNYNLKGEVVDMRPIPFAELRFNEIDELGYANKIGLHEDFGRNNPIHRTISNNATRENIKWFDRYNPDPRVILRQIIAAGSIDDYKGQILYYSGNGHSNYPSPPLLSAINYVLSDVENSVLVRKESATGFINSYILKTTMDSEDPTLVTFENALAEAQGARGSGKVITISGLAPEDVQSQMLEPILAGGGQSGAIIDNAEKSYKLDRDVILQAYLIPKSLGGADSGISFSGDELVDGYYIFNANTQEWRDVIEAKINNILAHSIFETPPIKIEKLKLDRNEMITESQPNDNKTPVENV